MKKKVLAIQVILMYMFLVMGGSPLKAEVLDTYSSSDIMENVTIGESISDTIFEQEETVYLLHITKDEKLSFTVEAEEEQDEEESDENTASWKVMKVTKEEGETGVVYQPKETVLEDTIKMNDAHTYSYQTKMELESSYYLIQFEAKGEYLCIDYGFSFEREITYADSIQIPASKIIKKGKSVRLKASGIQPAGAVAGITWSSGNSSVAKVGAKTGKVTGKKYGQTVIQAKLKNGKVYKCNIFVEQPKLNKKSVVLLKGEVTAIKVSGCYSDIKYSSSNKNVATVDSSGTIKAKGKGTAKITAKVGTTKLVCKVRAEEPRLTSKNVKLNAGKTKILKVQGTKQRVTWKSSDSSVASVSSNGKVTSKGAGHATISACVGGRQVLSCYVTVKAAEKKIKSHTTASDTVYITEYGKKYHRAGCRYLWNSRYAISRNNAISQGYDACSVCF